MNLLPIPIAVSRPFKEASRYNSQRSSRCLLSFQLQISSAQPLYHVYEPSRHSSRPEANQLNIVQSQEAPFPATVGCKQQTAELRDLQPGGDDLITIRPTNAPPALDQSL